MGDKFEQQFEDMDVKTQYMEGSMNATTATSTPSEQVDTLITMVADENNLELGEAFSEAGPVEKRLQRYKSQTRKLRIPLKHALQTFVLNSLRFFCAQCYILILEKG